jgi:hypothetical protein
MVTHRDNWDQHRREMLRETELFIEYGLAHPDEAMGIPAKRVGERAVPQAVSDWFWSSALTSHPSQTLQRWREHLRSIRRDPKGAPPA